MGWKKLVGYGLLLLLGSCFLQLRNYYNNEDGGIRPKRPRFVLAKNPYHLQKGDWIDTNSVYVESYTVTYPDSIQKREAFIRFFANGRYLSGVTKDFRRNYLILDDVNDINRGGCLSDILNWKIMTNSP